MLDAIDQKVVDDVAAHGFHSMGVGAGDGEPQFRYSVGFWESLGSPEVLIFGLDFKLMHSMLWEIFRQIKAGSALEDGKRYVGLLEGYDCIARPVHQSQHGEYFGFALWYRRYRNVDPSALEAYQLFWPGVEQRLFPWERGCVDEVRSAQPLLYLPRETGLA